MYKKLVGSMIVAVSLMSSQALFAKDSMCKQELKTMVDSLSLKDEQKTKIQPIVEQMKTAMKENGTQMDALKSQIREQLNAATVDQDAVNTLVDKKAALIGNMMKARITAEQQIEAVLTPEQKTSLQKMMQAEEEKMAEHFKSCHDDI